MGPEFILGLQQGKNEARAEIDRLKRAVADALADRDEAVRLFRDIEKVLIKGGERMDQWRASMTASIEALKESCFCDENPDCYACHVRRGLEEVLR